MKLFIEINSPDQSFNMYPRLSDSLFLDLRLKVEILSTPWLHRYLGKKEIACVIDKN